MQDFRALFETPRQGEHVGERRRVEELLQGAARPFRRSGARRRPKALLGRAPRLAVAHDVPDDQVGRAVGQSMTPLSVESKR